MGGKEVPQPYVGRENDASAWEETTAVWLVESKMMDFAYKFRPKDAIQESNCRKISVTLKMAGKGETKPQACVNRLVSTIT